MCVSFVVWVESLFNFSRIVLELGLFDVECLVTLRGHVHCQYTLSVHSVLSPNCESGSILSYSFLNVS